MQPRRIRRGRERTPRLQPATLGEDDQHTMTLTAEIPPNTAGGRDLVFGDVHGCFATAEHALETLDYDPSRDRLFSVGDLIDHGTGSEAALGWIQSRFTAVVRGNHEQMMLDWLWFGAQLNSQGGQWRSHWSSWWFPMSRPRETRIAWAQALCRLPFAATVHTAGGPVGLVHGAVTGDAWSHWHEVTAALERSRQTNNPTYASETAFGVLWERAAERHTTPEEATRPGLDGVTLTIHGHDPGPTPGWTSRNTLCVDTGVHWPELGHLTVAEIQTGRAELHQFARVDNDTLLEPPSWPAGLWDHGQGLNREAFIAAMGTSEHPTPLHVAYRAGTLTL